ncbi:MAG: phosphoadenosine phosphosulfate reductase family protein [Gammaproteobacteria bacterium]|nr:phosphoadenosine phosphosulfate reductase family protein [Gammaproteobacteria bacterium]
MYFIFGNYGDNTIAVIKWASLNNLRDVVVAHVDTGWSDSRWQQRVLEGQAFAKKCGFEVTTIKASHNFAQLIIDRKSFPNAKYQWCSTFLKAIPFIEWLDIVDDRCEEIIILGSRREDSRARQNLPEFIEQSQYYGDRKVWYPLFNTTQQERNSLIKQAGLKVLNSRSLECNPCIHSQLQELSYLAPEKISEIAHLEQTLNQTMFDARFPNTSIETLTKFEKIPGTTSMEAFDMGCGSHYVCGE